VLRKEGERERGRERECVWNFDGETSLKAALRNVDANLGRMEL